MEYNMHLNAHSEVVFSKPKLTRELVSNIFELSKDEASWIDRQIALVVPSSHPRRGRHGKLTLDELLWHCAAYAAVKSGFCKAVEIRSKLLGSDITSLKIKFAEAVETRSEVKFHWSSPALFHQIHFSAKISQKIAEICASEIVN